MRTSTGDALGDDAPFVEQQHAVGVLRGERQVVHRGDQGEALRGAECVQQLERVLLMADVERGGRLVEEHDRSLLRQRAGDDHPLALAAAQRAERPLGERVEIEPCERARGRFAVGCTLPRQRPQMWGSGP